MVDLAPPHLGHIQPVPLFPPLPLMLLVTIWSLPTLAPAEMSYRGKIWYGESNFLCHCAWCIKRLGAPGQELVQQI